MSRLPFVLALGFGLGVLGLSFPLRREIHVPIGSARGPLMMSGLGPSEAVIDLPREETADDRSSFYFRQIDARNTRVDIPLVPMGAFSIAARLDTTVRTRITATAEDGAVRSDVFALPGPWKELAVASDIRSGAVAFAIAFEEAPLVRRSDPRNFRRYIDEWVVRSEDGFKLPWRTRLAGGLLTALLILLGHAARSRHAAAMAALAGPALMIALANAEPVAFALGVPRLLPVAALSVALVLLGTRKLSIEPSSAAAVALLSGGFVLGCGSLSFLPNHSPADLDIHIWRTVDLADVPMSYDAWFRYGSHYPTASQIRGAATEALGEGPAIPYSPLPYIVFHLAHAAGFDLHWSMNAIEALSLSLLLPLVFAVAQTAAANLGGLLATALVALDLATIHHLGRAHSPAVFGGALGLGALLAFALALPTIDKPGRWREASLLLGGGALGYSSTPVFYALMGTALMVLLLMQRETRRLFAPVAAAFTAGGVIALLLFYGHYVPGLVWGGSEGARLADPFPGRTFFIFHNESRQSLRLWRLGFFVPFLAAIPAAFVVLKRCSATTRSFLFAWIAAWAGIMILKEPWAFPRLLRWAKEDFYVAPGLSLIIAIAISRVESRPWRLGLAAIALLTALCLRINDYGFHADTLRFMK